MEMILSLVVVGYFLFRVKTSDKKLNAFDWVFASLCVLSSVSGYVQNVETMHGINDLYRIEMKVSEQPNPVGVKFNGDIEDGSYNFANESGNVGNPGTGFKAGKI